MTPRHEILVVEDNPQNAVTLREMVHSMDMDCRVVDTLDEVRACLASGFEPCAVLQDMQIPHTAGARPHEKSGESSIALIQAFAKGKSRPPILVVTAFRSDPDYVWQMAELEVDGFVAKSNVESLPDKLRAAMKKCGREDHAKCAACNREARALAQASRGEDPAQTPAATESAQGTITLAMEGEPIRGRTSLRICGEQRLLPPARFAVLLRAVLAHERAIGSWSDRYELGIGDDRSMTTRVREPFKGLVPEGFQVIEGDKRKQFRLNPEIVVEATDWERLARHPDSGIRNIAAQAQKKKARGAVVET